MSSLLYSQASSCQSLRADDNVQSGLTSSTSLQENKAGGSVEASDQVAKAEQPAQVCTPL